MKLLPIVLILLAVAGGSVFGWHRAGRPDVMAKLRGARSSGGPERGGTATGEPSRTGGDAPRATGATGASAAGESPAETEPARPEARELPPARTAAALYERGRKQFDALEFAEAKESFEDAAALQSRDVHRQARKMAVLSDVFARATRAIPRLRDAAPSEVLLSNGREIIGYVTEGADGSVTVRKDDGITATLKEHEVESVRKLEASAWRERCEAELSEKLRKVRSDLPALDYYQAAYFAIRNGLVERAAPILMQCADAEGFELVIETFGDVDAARLVARWEEAIDPASAIAEPTRPPPEPVRPGTPPTADLSKAEELYREGLIHYRRSLPGMDNAQEELKRARKLFEQSVDAYRSASEADPTDRFLQERITKLQSLIYDCIKRAQV